MVGEQTTDQVGWLLHEVGWRLEGASRAVPGLDWGEGVPPPPSPTYPLVPPLGTSLQEGGPGKG